MAPSIRKMEFDRKTAARRLAKHARNTNITCRFRIHQNRLNVAFPIKLASNDRAPSRDEADRRTHQYSEWLVDEEDAENKEDELFVFYYCHCEHF